MPENPELVALWAIYFVDEINNLFNRKCEGFTSKDRAASEIDLGRVVRQVLRELARTDRIFSLDYVMFAIYEEVWAAGNGGPYPAEMHPAPEFSGRPALKASELVELLNSHRLESEHRVITDYVADSVAGFTQDRPKHARARKTQTRAQREQSQTRHPATQLGNPPAVHPPTTLTERVREAVPAAQPRVHFASSEDPPLPQRKKIVMDEKAPTVTLPRMSIAAAKEQASSEQAPPAAEIRHLAPLTYTWRGEKKSYPAWAVPLPHAVTRADISKDHARVTKYLQGIVVWHDRQSHSAVPGYFSGTKDQKDQKDQPRHGPPTDNDPLLHGPMWGATNRLSAWVSHMVQYKRVVPLVDFLEWEVETNIMKPCMTLAKQWHEKFRSSGATDRIRNSEMKPWAASQAAAASTTKAELEIRQQAWLPPRRADLLQIAEETAQSSQGQKAPAAGVGKETAHSSKGQQAPAPGVGKTAPEVAEPQTLNPESRTIVEFQTTAERLRDSGGTFKELAAEADRRLETLSPHVDDKTYEETLRQFFALMRRCFIKGNVYIDVGEAARQRGMWLVNAVLGTKPKQRAVPERDYLEEARSKLRALRERSGKKQEEGPAAGPSGRGDDARAADDETKEPTKQDGQDRQGWQTIAPKKKK